MNSWVITDIVYLIRNISFLKSIIFRPLDNEFRIDIYRHLPVKDPQWKFIFS